jgi:TPR repeat protein
VNQKIDRTKNFIEAIDTPLATVLTLIFSIALGVSLSLLLSRSDTPSALVPTAAAPDHSEIVNLLARGRAYLSDGDVALARVFLRRAAERHDPQAALALGGTYDPAELKRIGIPNFQAQADPAKAGEWYRRAADLGSADASSRLGELSLRRILVDERK